MSDNNSSKRSLGERINTWVQIVGILIAAAWGAYTFIYKEIELPSLIPVNLVISNPVIKKSPANSGLSAVQIQISAKNPSSREIHLLSGMWVALGTRVEAATIDDSAFARNASEAFKDSGEVDFVQRHAKSQGIVTVATGPLFGVDTLKPWGETTTNNVVFYIPANDYDEIQVSASMPSVANVNGLQMEWSVTKEGALLGVLYRVDERGKRVLDMDKPGLVKVAHAEARFSLWP